MPIPFLSSIGLNKNEVQDFKVFNLASDPTLTSGGDFGYFWLNTSGTKTLKFWDGASIRSLIDSTTISSSTAGTANDLSGGVAGSLPYQQGVGDTTFLGIGSSGYILTSTGSAPQWSASIPSSSVSGLAASATTDTTNASNISSGTLGLARLSLASGQFYVGDGSNNPAATAKSSIPLSGFGNAAADINIGGFKITNSGTIGSGDADSTVATKGYVDSVAQGLDVKASCLVASTADITLASPGAVTIDGIYSATDFTAGTTRILVKDQSAPAENGIYIWQGPSSAMTRSADANTWDELVGAFTFIERGTANADSGWVCTVNAGGTLGTTAVTFVKFSQAGSYTAGNGIVQSGTSFNFAQSSAYTAGQIPFAGGTLGTSSTTIGFDSNFVWDDQANRLGIGTASPAYPLSVNGRISYNTAIGEGADTTLSSSGTVLLHGNSSTWTEQRSYTGGTERLRIASDGVCTWSNVGGVVSNAMVLNGTGLGVGGTVVEKITAYGNILATDAAGTYPRFISTVGAKSWEIGYRSGTTNYELREDGTTRLVVANGGNVGIGTATPGKRLTVADASPTIRLNDTNTSVAGGVFGTIDWLSQDSSMPGGLAAKIDVYDDLGGYGDRGAIRFFTNNGTSLGERMVLTSSGNLGLGVTPANWSSLIGPVLQINNGSFYAYSNEIRINANFKYDGADKYISNGYATSYNQASGAHYWYSAANNTSGANAALTWGGAKMLLDASGNLGIGTASPSVYGKLAVLSGATATTAYFDTTAATAYSSTSFFAGPNITIRTAANATGNGSGIRFASSSNGSLEGFFGWVQNASGYGDFVFQGYNGAYTERLRIDSAGNMGLGVTPKSWATYKSISVGGVGAAVFGLGSSQSGVAQGCYYNNGSGTGFAYSATSQAASYYLQINGEHRWTTVSGGTVDTQISSFTQAMTLDASGRLIRGDTTADSIATDAATMVNIGNFAVQYTKNTGNFLVIKPGAPLGTVDLSADARTGAYPDMRFLTGGASRLSIKSTGQVNFVGQASDPAGAAAGDVYYNSGSNVFKVYDTGWKTLPRKYSTALAGTSTTFDVTHNLGTQDVTVMVRKSASTFDVVYTDIQVATTNKVTIVFASSVTGSDYTVTVIG